MADAVAAIRAGMKFDISADEREARMAAIQLLTDGRDRFMPMSIGRWIKSRG